jgi:hypothetical protein
MEHLFLRIPDCHGKHADESGQSGFDSPFFNRFQDDFGITGSFKDPTPAFKIPGDGLKTSPL